MNKKHFVRPLAFVIPLVLSALLGACASNVPINQGNDKTAQKTECSLDQPCTNGQQKPSTALNGSKNEDAVKNEPPPDCVDCKPVVVKPACKVPSVYFATDEYSISEQTAAQLVASLRACGDLKGLTITIGGHTDRRGTQAHNTTLSSRRAFAAAEVITKQLGVALDKDHVVGHGYEEAKDPPANLTPEEVAKFHAQYRRAAIDVTRP